MINHDLIDELAGLLDVERQEAARLLNSFAGGMVAKLLNERKISLKGLGSFTVTHHPATKKSTASSIVYSPPCNRLNFSAQMSGGDDTLRLAVSRLSMSDGDAARFARSLVELFTAAVQRQSEICFNGFGRFTLEAGVYSFVPDRSLEELLNREYQNLEEVVLPQHELVPDKRDGKLRYVWPLSALFLAGLLIVLLYGFYPEAFVFVSTSHQPHQGAVTASVQRNTAIAQKLPVQEVALNEAKVLPMGGDADSVVLARGDYTIVLATFRSEKTALRELVALRSGGIVAFVWPASLEGTKYYRLTTGKFSTRSAAKEYFKAMPGTTASGAYIQQVIKSVVLHGKKGVK